MAKTKKKIICDGNCHSKTIKAVFPSSPIQLGFSLPFHIHAKSKIDKKKA